MSEVSYVHELNLDRVRVDDFARTVTIERGEWERIDCYNGTLPTAPSPGRVYRREGLDKRSHASGPGNAYDTLYFVRDEIGGEPTRAGGVYQLHHPYRARVVDGPLRLFPDREKIR